LIFSPFAKQKSADCKQLTIDVQMEILRFILRGQSSSQPWNLPKQLKCQLLLLKQADFGEDIEFVSRHTV